MRLPTRVGRRRPSSPSSATPVAHMRYSSSGTWTRGWRQTGGRLEAALPPVCLQSASGPLPVFHYLTNHLTKQPVSSFGSKPGKSCSLTNRSAQECAQILKASGVCSWGLAKSSKMSISGTRKSGRVQNRAKSGAHFVRESANKKVTKISPKTSENVRPQDSQRDIGTPLGGFSQIFRQS